MPVHLTGRMCSMDKIMNISKKYKIPVIEEAHNRFYQNIKAKCQGHGETLDVSQLIH